MDKFERRLRDDAALIHAEVSEELDDRIRAALEAAAATKHEVTRARERPRRESLFWWASSLTGLAAAIVLVAMLNLGPRESGPAPAAEPEVLVAVPPAPVTMPALNTRTAVLTAPLEEELDDLEDDIEKAREAVRKDLGLEF